MPDTTAEQLVLDELEGEQLRFEELNERLNRSTAELEDAIRHLLHRQAIAETGDWKYYRTATTTAE